MPENAAVENSTSCLQKLGILYFIFFSNVKDHICMFVRFFPRGNCIEPVVPRNRKTGR